MPSSAPRWARRRASGTRSSSGIRPPWRRGCCGNVRRVRDFRHAHNDAYYYNWRLRVDSVFQQPFVATHESMARLEISRDLPTQVLAANLRRAFSGIVSGNIREDGIRAIEEHGPFEIRGDKDIMARLDALLRAFVEQHRMKLPGRAYEPCYRVVV